MTTMTTRVQGVFVAEIQAAARRTTTTPTTRPTHWASLRRWFASIQWSKVDDLRASTTAAVRHEAEERRLLGTLR